MVVHHNISRSHVGLVLVRKLSVTKAHGLVEILGIHGSCNFFCLLDSLHQGLSHNLVLVDSNEASLSLWRCLKHSPDSLDTLQGSEHSVICNRSSSSLNMAKSSDTGIKSKATLALVG